MEKHRIELLAPAKNKEIGIEAVNHGADAVYIGAPRFGARSAAGNSEADIEELVRYAHRYSAKVYVALNTLLKDEELPVAQKMIHSLYNMGVDALIVQDMGILKLDLPPISLHASTQTDNRTVEKVKFLSSAGFSQIVLARELSLKQIAEISAQTNVALEVFVHGALCVSYSGQCYVSQCLSGRSANRGECAQYCRLPYTLMDADQQILVSDKHLLSLKDLNQSQHLERLLDAGASSLKIEGRLKEMSYVKNVTAYYRKRLDAIFKKRGEYVRSSAGSSEFLFEPQPDKSFNRGFTSYFLDGRTSEHLLSADTPKSQGEYIGTVKEITKNGFSVAGIIPLHNGDGVCFLNGDGVFEGFRINKAESNRVVPAEMPTGLRPKMKLYRNYDHEFEKVLLKKSADRRIDVDIRLADSSEGFVLTMTDEMGNRAEESFTMLKEPAKNDPVENIKKQLTKLGNYPFRVCDIDLRFSSPWFIPSSQLSEWRRVVAEKLMDEQQKNYLPERRIARVEMMEYPEKRLTYLGNVSNQQAEAFYAEHGVCEIGKAYESEAPAGVPLMFTKYCLKYEMGWCPKVMKQNNGVKEPLTLRYKDRILRLEFDCRLCEMRVYDRE